MRNQSQHHCMSHTHGSLDWLLACYLASWPASNWASHIFLWVVEGLLIIVPDDGTWISLDWSVFHVSFSRAKERGEKHSTVAPQTLKNTLNRTPTLPLRQKRRREAAQHRLLRPQLTKASSPLLIHTKVIGIATSLANHAIEARLTLDGLRDAVEDEVLATVAMET